jgi:hypothetical protein
VVCSASLLAASSSPVRKMDDLMNRVRDVAWLIAVFVLCMVCGERTRGDGAVAAPAAAVHVGQSIDDAKRVLASRSIDVRAGGVAVLSDNPDADFVSVVLDPNHTTACIWFSKSKSRVTAIDMRFQSSAEDGDFQDPWVPATKIAIDDDGAYSVTFPRPSPPDRVKAAPAQPWSPFKPGR